MSFNPYGQLPMSGRYGQLPMSGGYGQPPMMPFAPPIMPPTPYTAPGMVAPPAARNFEKEVNEAARINLVDAITESAILQMKLAIGELSREGTTQLATHAQVRPISSERVATTEKVKEGKLQLNRVREFKTVPHANRQNIRNTKVTFSQDPNLFLEDQGGQKCDILGLTLKFKHPMKVFRSQKEAADTYTLTASQMQKERGFHLNVFPDASEAKKGAYSFEVKISVRSRGRILHLSPFSVFAPTGTNTALNLFDLFNPRDKYNFAIDSLKKEGLQLPGGRSGVASGQGGGEAAAEGGASGSAAGQPAPVEYQNVLYYTSIAIENMHGQRVEDRVAVPLNKVALEESLRTLVELKKDKDRRGNYIVPNTDRLPDYEAQLFLARSVGLGAAAVRANQAHNRKEEVSEGEVNLLYRLTVQFMQDVADQHQRTLEDETCHYTALRLTKIVENPKIGGVDHRLKALFTGLPPSIGTHYPRTHSEGVAPAIEPGSAAAASSEPAPRGASGVSTSGVKEPRREARGSSQMATFKINCIAGGQPANTTSFRLNLKDSQLFSKKPKWESLHIDVLGNSYKLPERFVKQIQSTNQLSLSIRTDEADSVKKMKISLTEGNRKNDPTMRVLGKAFVAVGSSAKYPISVS